MGELILCNQMLAAIPYYLEDASLNVYSLEELSYYIENNLYLLEADFINDELCSWVDKQLKLHETAVRLREIYRKSGTLSEFVECLLKQFGYHNAEQISHMVAALKDMENKPESECIKMRADRFVENKRYINAIYEYRKLLDGKQEQNQIFIGNVWHNLGCAYAGLFLFQESVKCFKRAYELNGNQKSACECLYAYRCMHDEKGFYEAATLFGIDEQALSEIENTLTEASRMEKIGVFEGRLEELFALDRDQEIGEIVTDWIDTYRKNCRI